MAKNQDRKCTDCAYCSSTSDSLGFVRYWCTKLPDMQVGDSNFVLGACKNFKSKEDKDETERKANNI